MNELKARSAVVAEEGREYASGTFRFSAMTRHDGEFVASATYQTNVKVLSPPAFGKPGSGLLVQFDDDEDDVAADDGADNPKTPLLK